MSNLFAFDGADARAQPIQIAVWSAYEGIVKHGFLFKNPDAGIGADLLKGWCDLFTYGQAFGFDFVTFDQVEDWQKVDAIILCDRPLPGNPLVEAALRSSARKYLITAACPIIYPPSWDTDYHQNFYRIWTWDDSLVDGKRYLKCNTAVDHFLRFDFEDLKAQFNNRKLVTIIAGAKTSQHPNELYSHRIRTIRWFEATAPEYFDLYCIGWSKDQFPSYRGAVSDKLGILSQYRFCICYENAMGYPGYITEKLIDCLRSGTVPLYGGAPNVTRWIPEDCFIPINQFPTYYDLFAYLQNMDAAMHAAFLDRIARFVNGPNFYPFSIACMIEGFTRTLNWDLRNQVVGKNLVQNASTLRMEVCEAVSVQPIVWMTYDQADPLHQKLRGLWHFFSSHYPQIQFFFVRHTDDLSSGEIADNGYDILIGGIIDLQIPVHDLVLRRFSKPFVLMQTTLFDVFDPQRFSQICSTVEPDTYWIGTVGKLMGHVAVESSKLQFHANSAWTTLCPVAQEWSAALALPSLYSEDPMELLEKMRQILQA